MKLLLMMMAQAWAQEGGAEHAEVLGIPWQNILAQAVNLFFLLALLTYFLRHSVKAHFTQRAAEYREMVERAEAARKEAQQNHDSIKQRLTQLEASATQSVANARSESEILRQKLTQEAQVLAQRLEREAQRTASVELDKAKAELRRELLGKALHLSTENLRKGLGSVEQQKLQSEFADKIEVVSG
jgi:F-type H+-transporting ATPase subunit b